MSIETKTRKTATRSTEVIFRSEIMPHIDNLYSYAMRLTQNGEDAKDLVQDTFMRAYRYIGYYEDGTNAKSWLFKIMQNHYINGYRKKQRQPTQVDIDEVRLGTGWMQKELAYNSMSYSFGDEVVTALDRLPEELKMILLLKDVEGFKYEEISKIMDIPLGTVKSSLFRARNIVKKSIQDPMKAQMN